MLNYPKSYVITIFTIFSRSKTVFRYRSLFLYLLIER
jgi:hypothetical protein